MIRSSGRRMTFVIFGCLACALVLLVAERGNSAPKAGKGALEPLFAKSGYKDVKAQTGDNDSVFYSIKVSDSTYVTVAELSTGYAWVWSTVTNYDSTPPLRVYRTIAELNDSSRLGSLSVGPRTDSKPGSGVFLNFFFLMRTADSDALQEYIDSIAVQCEDMRAKLNQ